MMTNERPKPESPLPWSVDEVFRDTSTVFVESESERWGHPEQDGVTVPSFVANTGASAINADYIVWAANAAPELEAENKRLREENRRLGGPTTMMACKACGGGVRPRDAVAGLCTECATKRMEALEAENAKLRREAAGWEAAFTAASRWLYEPTEGWLRMGLRERIKANATVDPEALADFRAIERGRTMLAQKGRGGPDQESAESPYPKAVKVECPKCEGVCAATVRFPDGDPFPSLGHTCEHCGYQITESEWNEVTP